MNRGVTTHGFALNVDPDLTYFDHIIACGMPDVATTSMSLELGHHVSVDDAIAAFMPHFARMFGFELSQVEPTSVQSTLIDTPLPE